MLPTWSLSSLLLPLPLPFFTSPPPPLPSTFSATKLHPLRRIYLDVSIYIARHFRIPRLPFLQQKQRRDGSSRKERRSNTSFRVAKLSRRYYIKWGVRENEARSMAWVREMTDLPVPKVYNFWSDSSISTTTANSGSERGYEKSSSKKKGKKLPELNYLLLECLPGVPISDVWAELSPSSRLRFESEFIHYLSQLRQLPQPPVPITTSPSNPSDGLYEDENINDQRRINNYISGLNYTPLADHRISTAPYGPFPSVSSWLDSEYLLGYVLRSRPMEVHTRLLTSLTKRAAEHNQNIPTQTITNTTTNSPTGEPNSANSLKTVFTHSDFTPRNILVDESTGRITGILDWECAGWNVEWWEGVKGVYGWHDDEDAPNLPQNGHTQDYPERRGEESSDTAMTDIPSTGLMKVWKDLLTRVVGDFDEELAADEEMRDIYGFPF